MYTLVLDVYKFLVCIFFVYIHLQSAVSSDANQPNFDLIWEDLQVLR